jgi:TetR/AcrR family transcriptional regulator, tetracycline repressor protein
MRPDAAGAPKRGKPPGLTEKQIVDAALSIIREEGLDGLSMRRLSRELGRSAMAPYWHVADKQELLDLVAREVLAEVAVPAPESGPWEDRLRAVIDAIDQRLRRYPGIAEVLFARMQSADRRLILGIMNILVSAGFSDTDVVLGYAMVHTYLYGRYQVVLLADDRPPAEIDSDLERLLSHLPQLRGHDFFAFGVDTLIEGLRTRLAANS